MSTLQQVPRITGGEIYLTAAGRRIAAVGSCEIQARREGVPAHSIRCIGRRSRRAWPNAIYNCAHQTLAGGWGN